MRRSHPVPSPMPMNPVLHPVRGLPASLFGAWLLFAAALPAQSSPPTPTHVVDYTMTVFPDTTGDFEKTTIVRSQYAPTWAPWTMSLHMISIPGGVSSGAGIAKNGAPLIAQSAPAPSGDYVCFVQGGGTAQCNVLFQPGTWKLRFRAAQRLQGTTPDQQALRVTIGGANVFEQMIAGSTFAEYVTAPVVVTTATTMQVKFAGLETSTNANMALVDYIQLDREFPWNDPLTWGTAGIPGTTSDVKIGEGAEVVMDGTCTAATVNVMGLLRAGTVDATLTTGWVMVHGDAGEFRVGTAATPFQNQFTLTLVGAPSAVDVMGGGTKFLMAMDGGRIEMHGTPTTSWTKLTQVTGNVIRVAGPVGWSQGDKIVVVRSKVMPQDASPLDAAQSEVREVMNVNSTTGDITLDLGFTHLHCTAGPATWSNPSATRSWQLDQRAEVGLLTRNVRVEAADDTDANVAKFGGHVMLMNCPMCSSPGTGRFSYVQFTRMGQEERFGRYPLHWHMQLANGQGQYARGCSIWNSYNRAIVIHGSDHLTIEDNVCYEHVGHGVFLEDGGERHNRILRNLVVRTLKPTAALALLPHDAAHNEPQNRSPAAFWITNPQNEFEDNVAADTIGTGYWFALHQQPFNQSSDLMFTGGYFAPGGQPLNATTLPLGTFRRNVAHSVRTAIDLNDSVAPNTMTLPLQQDDVLLPNVPWRPTTPATLEGFVAYGCATALYAGGGADTPLYDDVTFTDAVLADNEWHVQFACAFTVTDSLFVAQTNNSIFVPTHPAFTGVAYLPYDGPGRVLDSHWVGFDGTTMLSPMAVSTVFGASQRHTNHVLQGITRPAGSPPFRIVSLINFAAEVPDPNPTVPCAADSRHWGIAVANEDGSVGGQAGRTLVTNHPMMRMPTGLHPDITHAAGSAMYWSWYRWGYLRMEHHQQNGAQLGPTQQPTMTFTRWDHDNCPGASFTAGFQVDAHRQLPVLVRREADTTAAECWYTIDWTPPANAKKLRIRMQDLGVGDVSTLHFLKGDGWTGESVWVGQQQLTMMSSIDELAGMSETAYTRTHGQSLWLRIVNPAPTADVWIHWQ